MTHICIGKLTIIGSDNGLSPGRHQAIICTNTGILLIRPLGTNFTEISIGIQTFSFKKIYLIMSPAKWRPFCLRLNVLRCPSILCAKLFQVNKKICLYLISLLYTEMAKVVEILWCWHKIEKLGEIFAWCHHQINIKSISPGSVIQSSICCLNSLSIEAYGFDSECVNFKCILAITFISINFQCYCISVNGAEPYWL